MKAISPQVLDIYRQEMRSRIERLRVALVLCGGPDPAARASALYDSHLQAHTIKGTSIQLGYASAGRFGAVVCALLEQARESGNIDQLDVDRIDRGCNAFITWLDQGQVFDRQLKLAADIIEGRGDGL